MVQHSLAGSRESRPYFLPDLLRCLRTLVVVLVTAPLGLSFAAPASPKPADGAAGYRLAGVISVGQDRIGFLEVPAGGQVLVRLGSVVNGGKVTVFSDREVRIVFPTRTVVLELQGGDGKSADEAALGVVVGEEDNGQTLVRQVDADNMVAALKSLRQDTATTSGTAARPDAAADLGRRFASIAHLPPNARVVAVNDEPVKSAAQAIAEVEKTLAKGQGTTLNLETSPGQPPDRVYLVPKRD